MVMVGGVRQVLFDIEDENERLQGELASSRIARLTEYAVARASGDATLRRLGWIAERLHLGITEMTGDETLLPRFQ
ncbi:hypothetical protein [Roseixanthobacter glucoisosaccharinicivorans]|uniref:hypothetical protein n=1 Tax=Roseixanthobacter glucoisosaccharinicivorans TaxID=3119923 RepID=UPI00372B84C7